MASRSFAIKPNPALAPIQEAAIVLIAAGNSINDVAKQCRIHRNIIGYWRRTNPAFSHALADAQYDRTLYFRDEAEEHATLAIAVIADLLSNPKIPPAVRLRAALAMLKHATTAPGAPPPSPAEPVVQPAKTESMHNSAQCPTPSSGPGAPPATAAAPIVQTGNSENMHNPAQKPSPHHTPSSSPRKSAESSPAGQPYRHASVTS